MRVVVKIRESCWSFSPPGYFSPFMAAVLTDVVSQRWSVLTRATLDVTVLVIMLGTLAICGDVAFGHTGAKIGFVFLMVPFASWLLIAVAVPIAALVSRRQTG